MYKKKKVPMNNFKENNKVYQLQVKQVRDFTFQDHFVFQKMRRLKATPTNFVKKFCVVPLYNNAFECFYNTLLVMDMYDITITNLNPKDADSCDPDPEIHQTTTILVSYRNKEKFFINGEFKVFFLQKENQMFAEFCQRRSESDKVFISEILKSQFAKLHDFQPSHFEEFPFDNEGIIFHLAENIDVVCDKMRNRDCLASIINVIGTMNTETESKCFEILIYILYQLNKDANFKQLFLEYVVIFKRIKTKNIHPYVSGILQEMLKE